MSGHLYISNVRKSLRGKNQIFIFKMRSFVKKLWFNASLNFAMSSKRHYINELFQTIYLYKVIIKMLKIIQKRFSSISELLTLHYFSIKSGIAETTGSYLWSSDKGIVVLCQWRDTVRFLVETFFSMGNFALSYTTIIV